MKKYLYRFHSWLGLIAGLGLLLIGLTGTILVFKTELDRLLAPQATHAENPSLPRLPEDEFYAKVRAELPGHAISGWGRIPGAKVNQVYATPLGASEGRPFYADATTGKILGSHESGNLFTDWILELHYSFFAGHPGVFIAGVFAVILCLLGITGVWIYRKFWKTLFLLRWGKSARIVFSDIHKMVGIFSTLFNLILGFTGAWWNISHAIADWSGHEPEPVVKSVESHLAPGLSIDHMLAEAEKKAPGFQPNWISLPTPDEPTLSAYGAVAGQNPFRSDYSTSATFDAKTGEPKITLASDEPLTAQILDAFRPLHYGTFGGLPTKILWSLGGLTPGILALTGSLMWWKRKFRKPSKRNVMAG
ncbi:MAG: PepSY-associated TM helix domain-containing protein [Luteolibacter sp.]